MADLKRCDRCFEIFEPNKADTINTVNGNVKSVMPAYISFSRYTNDHFAQWDLCPKCVAKFQDFMRSGKEVNHD